MLPCNSPRYSRHSAGADAHDVAFFSLCARRHGRLRHSCVRAEGGRGPPGGGGSDCHIEAEHTHFPTSCQSWVYQQKRKTNLPPR